MPISFHSAVVPPFEQILKSVAGLIEKAEEHCAANGIAPEELIQARLAPSMHPFAYQVKSTAVHSIGAIEGVRCGTFSPDDSDPGDSFAALSDRIEQARAALSALRPEDVDSLADKPLRFIFGKHYADFIGVDFLLRFSKPNFYFHATTAYDILRMKGLAIGKIDYLGGFEFKRMPEDR